MSKPKTFRPWNPEQTLLLPPSPVEWLPEQHLVFFLLDLVAELDLSAIVAVYEQRDPRGVKAYDPRMPGGPGELPPEAPTDPYVTLSRHTAPVIPTLLPQVMPMAPLVGGSALFSELLALLPANWLMLWLSLDNAAPSLQSYYSSFITTTGCSAPAMGIGIRPRGCGHLWLSLGTPWQVPTFRIEACDELMPPEHRLPRGP